MKAIWNGRTLAESNSTVVVEGNHYFPANAIDKSLFRASDHKTTCAWKGEASYYDIIVDGKINENAAWYYSNPSAAAAEIKDRVAFWKGVSIVP